MSSEMKLLIRADASPSTGTRHVTRCLSLAKAWKSFGGKTTFVCGKLPGSLEQTIIQQGFSTYSIANSNCDGTDARETSEIAMAIEPDWIVLDGEKFNDSYQSKLRTEKSEIAVIDDLGHAENMAADVVVRQREFENVKQKFKSTSTQQILRGPQYFLNQDQLNQSPLDPRDKKIVTNARRILIWIDAPESNDSVVQILEMLSNMTSARLVVDVVVPPTYTDYEALRQIKIKQNINLRCHRNLDRLVAIIDRVDLAISSADSNCLELARHGVPSLLFSTHESQIPLAKELHRKGTAIYEGSMSDLDCKLFSKQFRSVIRDVCLRRKLSNRSHQVVNGHGASKIASRLATKLFELRPADITDAEELHIWRNEPEYRALSFNSQPISLAAHHVWMERKLKSDKSILWIANDKSSLPIGTITVDFQGHDSALLAICLCPSQRGRGLAQILIEKASLTLLRDYHISRVVAQVKLGNTNSQLAFRNAGFRPIAPTTVGSKTALQFAFERNRHAIADEAIPHLRKSA